MSESLPSIPGASAAGLPSRPPPPAAPQGGKSRSESTRTNQPQPGDGAYLTRPQQAPKHRRPQPPHMRNGAQQPPRQRGMNQQQGQIDGGGGNSRPYISREEQSTASAVAEPQRNARNPPNPNRQRRDPALPSIQDRLQQNGVEHNGFHNALPQGNGNTGNDGRRGQPRRERSQAVQDTADASSSDRRQPRAPKSKGKGKAATPAGAETLNPDASVFQPAPLTSVSLPDPSAELEPAPPVRSRRAAFQKSSQLTDGSGLTSPNATSNGNQQQTPKRTQKRQPKPRKEFDTGVKPDDLTSRLIVGLSNKPFLECPICFLSLLPHQQVWSCLPAPITQPAPASQIDKDSSAYAHPTTPAQPIQGSCYTPFHLSCIADWAQRSLKDATLKEMKPGEVPEWRCPGCQKKRTGEVKGYRCFCDAVPNPKYVANSLITPHSCGQSCMRRRPNCYHGCPLTCHPGPCPPCQVPVVVPCPSHTTPLSMKCSIVRSTNASVPACGLPCMKTKSCGKAAHQCLGHCHEGPCEPCDESEHVRCYCGVKELDAQCGWNKDHARECLRPVDDATDLEVDDAWTGRFACGQPCPRKYDCGIHPCPENCHDHPLQPIICPTSPAIISHCPCGRNELSSISETPRTSCLDPIPTCSSPCTKSRPCGHPCPEKCHNGECPPCGEEVVRPCRCGEGVVLLPCTEVKEREESGEEITCERICKALRSCGRHECGRQCCPLAYKAKFKGKRRLMDDPLDQPGEEDLQLHACPLVCGRPLGCGLHTCPKPDHKGACGRCLDASYDELICHCTHTVIFPPVPCGTSMNCTYPCARPPPACGHPKTLHTCHENEDCPPCPYLRDRECACGKNPAVKNIRCSQERVSCGAVCGNLLDCGFHTCEKSCHPKGECGECTQVCRKPKKICGHPCQAVCHAPARCPENDACSTIVTQSCACGHLQNRGSCGASVTNPVSREKAQLKCVGECLLRQRNARLADALGIKPAERNLEEWAPELKAFCTQNHSFVRTVEQTFKDFFAGSRQVMVLPHMPPAKRTFVISMADVYRLGRELVDQEPQRSVQIRRRVDTRIPNPLLSEAAPPPPSRPQLGGLANLRQTSASKSSSALNLKAPIPGPIKKAWASGPSTPRVGSPVTTAPGTPSAAPAAPLAASSAGPTRLDLPVVLPDDDTAKDWDLSDNEA